MLSFSRLVAIAALMASLLERWGVVQPALWLLSAALVPPLFADRNRLLSVTPGAPLALLCLFVPASLAWNDDPFHSYPSVLTFVSFVVIAMWLVLNETPTAALGLVTVAAALSGIAGVIVAVLYPDLIPQINPGAMQGIYTHKNWFALAMGYLILAAIYSRFRHRAGRTLVLVGGTSLFILSQSTGAVIAMGVTLLVLGVRFWSRRRLPPIHQQVLGIVALAAGAAAVILSLQWTFRLAVEFGEGRDVNRRLQLWNVVLEYATHRPLLGWGWRGSWSNTSGVTGQISRDMSGFQASCAHSGYVDLFLQAGLVGSALVVVLLVGVIWPRLNDPSLRGWSALALFSAVFTLSDSFLAGHVPILVVITGWLYGRNAHLWRTIDDTGSNRSEGAARCTRSGRRTFAVSPWSR